MEKLQKQLENYQPYNEQEQRDLQRIQEFLKEGKTCFQRENPIAHFTASGWIVNPQRTKVLMVYHNIYKSWSWTGGHADGEQDLLAVALREAREETGLKKLQVVSPDMYSVEVLTVDGHAKRGCYVSSHLHMNVTYLLEAEEDEALMVKADENSAVEWIPIETLSRRVSEAWMMERIYQKLCDKL